MYINGALDKSGTSSDCMQVTAPLFGPVIGKHPNTANQCFSGVMDELSVWTGALEDYQVEWLYNNGVGNFPTP